MRISDWSSDVCSSDLLAALGKGVAVVAEQERTRVRHPRVRQRVLRIDRDRMLVHADRVQEVASAHRVEVLAALEVEIVGAGVGGGVVLQRAALLRADRKSTRLNSSH